MADASGDERIRAAAMAHVADLTRRHGRLTWAQISAGLVVDGQHVHLATQAKGIFKPEQMRSILSIKTVMPKPGRARRYDDQSQAHGQLFRETDTVDYAFRGPDPRRKDIHPKDLADNQGLLLAMEHGLPLIYFLGVAPGIYEAIMPVFIADWDPDRLKVRLSFAQTEDRRAPGVEFERRYALAQVKRRLHQSMFREAVLEAYQGRCALSGVPEPRLIDAAHIMPDADEMGLPVVRNGLTMSKIHHAAFDAHLLGVDHRGQIHVSPILIEQKDGPILEAIKSLHGTLIRSPRRREDMPDPDLLAIRFREFEAAARTGA